MVCLRVLLVAFALVGFVTTAAADCTSFDATAAERSDRRVTFDLRVDVAPTSDVVCPIQLDPPLDCSYDAIVAGPAGKLAPVLRVAVTSPVPVVNLTGYTADDLARVVPGQPMEHVEPVVVSASAYYVGAKWPQVRSLRRLLPGDPVTLGFVLNTTMAVPAVLRVVIECAAYAPHCLSRSRAKAPSQQLSTALELADSTLADLNASSVVLMGDGDGLGPTVYGNYMTCQWRARCQHGITHVAVVASLRTAPHASDGLPVDSAYVADELDTIIDLAPPNPAATEFSRWTNGTLVRTVAAIGVFSRSPSASGGATFTVTCVPTAACDATAVPTTRYESYTVPLPRNAHTATSCVLPLRPPVCPIAQQAFEARLVDAPASTATGTVTFNRVLRPPLLSFGVADPAGNITADLRVMPGDRPALLRVQCTREPTATLFTGSFQFSEVFNDVEINHPQALGYDEAANRIVVVDEQHWVTNSGNLGRAARLRTIDPDTRGIATITLPRHQWSRGASWCVVDAAYSVVFFAERVTPAKLAGWRLGESAQPYVSSPASTFTRAAFVVDLRPEHAEQALVVVCGATAVHSMVFNRTLRERQDFTTNGTLAGSEVAGPEHTDGVGSAARFQTIYGVALVPESGFTAFYVVSMRPGAAAFVLRRVARDGASDAWRVTTPSANAEHAVTLPPGVSASVVNLPLAMQGDVLYVGVVTAVVALNMSDADAPPGPIAIAGNASALGAAEGVGADARFGRIQQMWINASGCEMLVADAVSHAVLRVAVLPGCGTAPTPRPASPTRTLQGPPTTTLTSSVPEVIPSSTAAASTTPPPTTPGATSSEPPGTTTAAPPTPSPPPPTTPSRTVIPQHQRTVTALVRAPTSTPTLVVPRDAAVPSDPSAVPPEVLEGVGAATSAAVVSASVLSVSGATKPSLAGRAQRLSCDATDAADTVADWPPWPNYITVAGIGGSDEAARARGAVVSTTAVVAAAWAAAVLAAWRRRTQGPESTGRAHKLTGQLIVGLVGVAAAYYAPNVSEAAVYLVATGGVADAVLGLVGGGVAVATTAVLVTGVTPLAPVAGDAQPAVWHTVRRECIDVICASSPDGRWRRAAVPLDIGVAHVVALVSGLQQAGALAAAGDGVCRTAIFACAAAVLLLLAYVLAVRPYAWRVEQHVVAATTAATAALWVAVAAAAVTSGAGRRERLERAVGWLAIAADGAMILGAFGLAVASYCSGTDDDADAERDSPQVAAALACSNGLLALPPVQSDANTHAAPLLAH